MQALVEIPAGQDAALDLSGDVGAIGRLTVPQPHDNGVGIVLDLKGAIYDAKLLPLAGTACVVSLGGKEAKVRFLASTGATPHSK